MFHLVIIFIGFFISQSVYGSQYSNCRSFVDAVTPVVSGTNYQGALSGAIKTIISGIEVVPCTCDPSIYQKVVPTLATTLDVVSPNVTSSTLRNATTSATRNVPTSTNIATIRSLQSQQNARVAVSTTTNQTFLSSVAGTAGNMLLGMVLQKIVDKSIDALAANLMSPDIHSTYQKGISGVVEELLHESFSQESNPLPETKSSYPSSSTLTKEEIILLAQEEYRMGVKGPFTEKLITILCENKHVRDIYPTVEENN